MPDSLFTPRTGTATRPPVPVQGSSGRQVQVVDLDRLTVTPGEGAADIAGAVDLEALAMAVVGSVAGGP